MFFFQMSCSVVQYTVWGLKLKIEEMTKRQQNTAFNQLIDDSNIFKTIETLEGILDQYRQLAIIQRERYLVETEINQLDRMVLELKNKLNDFIQKSIQWEALE